MKRCYSLAAGLVLLCAVSPAGAADLVSPITKAHAPLSGAAVACRPLPEPVISLNSQPYYTDGAFSVIDPEKLAREQAAAKPLNQLLNLVQQAANDHRRGKPGAAACALAALDSWARAGALLGAFTLQGSYQRKWTLGGAALAYLSIRDAPNLPPETIARVNAWIGKVGRAVRPYYDKRAIANQNNHDYWAGLTVAAAGLVADDRAMVEWGVSRLRQAMTVVTAEGGLPRELARKRMALHYHLFSLPPLAALARIAEANGMALNASEQAALDRLARFTFEATQDPARIAMLAGEPQDDPFLKGRPALVQGAGLELWLLTKPANQGVSRPASEPALDAALKAFRPYRMSWLGGDIQALWAAP